MSKDVFDLFDANGDGYVTSAELALVLYAAGCNPTQKEAVALAQQANPQDPEMVSWQQCQQLLLSAPRPDRSSEQYLMEAFRVFDKNEDGKIPENDLRVIFTTLGEQVELTDMNQLLQQVKVDSNGKVNYADFVKVILK